MHVRRIRLATLALAGSLALAGCGSSGGAGGRSPVDLSGPTTTATTGSTGPTGPATPSSGTTLTRAQTAAAVISLDDLGAGFEVDPDDSDEEGSSLGCLDNLDHLMGQASGGADLHRSAAKHDAQYKATTELGMPFVMSSVSSMRSSADIRLGLSLIEKAFTKCRSVDSTDANGTRTQLTITTDRTRSKGADDQLNLTATGHMSLPTPTGQTISVPFYLRASLAQVGNNLALIGYGSMVEPGEGAVDSEGLDTFAVARLRAVASGTPIPAAPDFGLRRITTDDMLAGLSGGSTGSV